MPRTRGVVEPLLHLFHFLWGAVFGIHDDVIAIRHVLCQGQFTGAACVLDPGNGAQAGQQFIQESDVVNLDRIRVSRRQG